MTDSYAITAFYKFFPVADTTALQVKLDAKGKELKMWGLTLVASEGVNGTVCGTPAAIEAFKAMITEIAGDVTFKDSTADEVPFKRWFVKVREEIVGLGDTGVVPEDMDDESHLTPAQWNDVIANEDVVVLDTRNDYETEIGVFKDAVDPNLKQFSEFPEWVDQCEIPKDKKVLMYCTGGIRCEKAQQVMKRKGYDHVYQLKGGILQYIKECPDELWEGECFVFDHRTAVDQQLQPSSRYSLCPHTGDPGDQLITCECGNQAKVHKRCLERADLQTCSKDCAERFRRKNKKVSS